MSYIKQNFLEFVTNLTCPHEDEKLAFWMKLVLGFICAVSILNGLLFGTDENYLVALSGMVIVLVGNCLICRKYKQWWIDVVTCWLLSVPVGYIFCHACVGYFTIMFLLIYGCGVIFILGIRDSIAINAGYLVLINICLRLEEDSPVRERYGDNIALRFPYLFVCIILIVYCLMYMIQSYWVQKNRSTQILERRIYDERQNLDVISMKVMNAMVSALNAKIPGKEEHCRCVAEYARELAVCRGLEKQLCTDAYHSGLLHEIGMIGIPDILIQRSELTDEEYQLYQAYVEKGYQIISTLRSDDTSRVAEAVLCHRENYDGSGFPAGIKGEEIPVLARLLAVADYTDRHLRRNESVEQVIEQLLARSGKVFEAESVRLMVHILTEANLGQHKKV